MFNYITHFPNLGTILPLIISAQSFLKYLKTYVFVKAQFYKICDGILSLTSK